MTGPTGPDWTAPIIIVLVALVLGLAFVLRAFAVGRATATAPAPAESLERRDLLGKRDALVSQLRELEDTAAKRTSELIPLCHPLALTKVDIAFEIDQPGCAVECRASVETIGRTGVEMEALTATAVALLTI